ncbi:unnamed protein product [Cuscuta campestris]|uniref:Reverse transcriptase domain-containing protein n=1 Tax=Cuscuta campestris TaxID=132261 RepID=A0A484NK36_9ASTE|nr:unnamed protein product [Cuscuta campestris]
MGKLNWESNPHWEKLRRLPSLLDIKKLSNKYANAVGCRSAKEVSTDEVEERTLKGEYWRTAILLLDIDIYVKQYESINVNYEEARNPAGKIPTGGGRNNEGKKVSFSDGDEDWQLVQNREKNKGKHPQNLGSTKTWKRVECPGDANLRKVYGKHNEKERENLWHALSTHNPNNHLWIVGGDFNAVTRLEDHKGSDSPSIRSMTAFQDAINSCELNGLEPIAGGTFTWYGVRSLGKVWRRLERIFVNNEVLYKYTSVSLSHLSKSSSDHKTLLQCKTEVFTGVKPFRFLNCWCSREGFQDVVKSKWNSYNTVGGMKGLADKLRQLKGDLKEWNKPTYVNIFDKGRRAKLKIESIKRDNGQGITDEEGIANSAIDYYSTLYNEGHEPSLQPILDNIQTLVNNEDNQMLSELPTLEEVQQADWELNETSASGPDGFTGGNVIIKLDIAKGFDKVSWGYLREVMKKMGFNHKIPVEVGMAVRLMAELVAASRSRDGAQTLAELAAARRSRDGAQILVRVC